MQDEQGEHTKLARPGGLLKGGVVIRITSREAIYTPVILHAVFTVQGGFLVSIQLHDQGHDLAFVSVYQIRNDGNTEERL
jgi:hypothetical protein